MLSVRIQLANLFERRYNARYHAVQLALRDSGLVQVKEFINES